MGENFLAGWEPVSSSRRTVLHGVTFVSPDKPPFNQPHRLPATSQVKATWHFYKVTLSTTLSCIFLPWWSGDSSGHTETQTWNIATILLERCATDISLVPQPSKYNISVMNCHSDTRLQLHLIEVTENQLRLWPPGMRRHMVWYTHPHLHGNAI
jgi:hypothetical protein